MSLKAKVGKLRGRLRIPEDKPGFQFLTPALQHFQAEPLFRKALKDQAGNVARVDAKHLKAIDIEGNVEGTDWRLSPAAFGDICHFTKMPVSFLRRLSKIEEQVALDVVQCMLQNAFMQGQGRTLVIDTRNGRVDGIVGSESYAPIANIDVLDYALSGGVDLEVSNGWIEGTTMRVTATSKGNPIEPSEGDIVHYGMSLGNSLQGDCSVYISDYFERLVCTNGMTARDAEHTTRVLHRGDVEFGVQEAVVKASKRAELLIPVLKRAAKTFLDDKDIRSIRAFVGDVKNGGNSSLDVKVVKSVVQEVENAGRAEGEVTLWDFVNGVTAAAHDAPSLPRRVELESLGYRTLARFGALLATN